MTPGCLRPSERCHDDRREWIASVTAADTTAAPAQIPATTIHACHENPRTRHRRPGPGVLGRTCDAPASARTPTLQTPTSPHTLPLRPALSRMKPALN